MLNPGTAEQLGDWGGGGEGAPLMTRYWGVGTTHLCLPTLYNFKNNGWGVALASPVPQSLTLLPKFRKTVSKNARIFKILKAQALLVDGDDWTCRVISNRVRHVIYILHRQQHLFQTSSSSSSIF